MDSLSSLAEQLLDAARAAGADAADAIAMRGADIGVAVRGGALEEAERAESVDFGLRVFIGRRQACVSASDPRPETLRVLAERAAAMAREAPEDPYCGLLDPSELGDAVDPATLSLTDDAPPPAPARLEELALAAEAAALAEKGVSQVDSASASWRRAEIALAATNGFRGAYARDAASIAVSAIAGEGLGMQSDYDYAARRRMADLPAPEEIGRKAAERAVARLDARKPPTGAVPVVFDRRVAPSLIGHVLSAINGASVARGSSWLAHRMGDRILPDWADLLEDPLAPNGPASRPFDGEGMASRASSVLRAGVLERWLLDAASARQLGLRSTGNARRGVSSPPSPGASNIRLVSRAPQPPASREALIGDIERGLLVTSLMGSSVNPTTGAYSRGASGFWIENGRIAHPVEEATIAGSLPEFLLRLELADDPDPFVSISVPSLRVEGLVVAGA